MNFLTPLFLTFAALSIPILILYMLKLRRREVWVSSTLLWQRLLRDREANTPWQRLRSNLLLLLQLLTLALLTLALARPFLPTPSIASGSVVILLDGSASMQATDVPPTRFEAGRRAAREVLDGLDAQDTATLILVGPQPQVLAAATGDRASTCARANGPTQQAAASHVATQTLRCQPPQKDSLLLMRRPNSFCTCPTTNRTLSDCDGRFRIARAMPATGHQQRTSPTADIPRAAPQAERPRPTIGQTIESTGGETTLGTARSDEPSPATRASRPLWPTPSSRRRALRPAAVHSPKIGTIWKSG